MEKQVTFPLLETERLTLRKLAHEDIEEIYFLRSNPDVLHYIDREPETREGAMAWIERVVGQNERGESFQWIIVPHGSEKGIGSICFWNLEPERNKAELGYVLHPDFHGKGIMQEALDTVMAYGSETMGLKLVEAITHRENLKSRALLERNDFQRDKGLEKERVATGEEPEEATIYVRNF